MTFSLFFVMELSKLRILGKEHLKEARIEDYATDADLLLSFVTEIDKNEFILRGEEEISPFVEKRYKRLLECRSGHVPLQHITGKAFFYGNEFIVSKDTLIPRFDTEILVEEAAKFFKDGMLVLDMFTGSGCVIVSLAKEFRGRGEFFGADISENALMIARENAQIHNVSVNYYCGDMTLPIPKEQRFDIITANPPYIRKKDIEELSVEVKKYEPYSALNGGEDGLLFYRRMSTSLKDFLKPGGVVLTEIGYDQGPAVSEIFQSVGFKNIFIKKDLSGLDRVVGMEYV